MKKRVEMTWNFERKLQQRSSETLRFHAQLVCCHGLSQPSTPPSCCSSSSCWSFISQSNSIRLALVLQTGATEVVDNISPHGLSLQRCAAGTTAALQWTHAMALESGHIRVFQCGLRLNKVLAEKRTNHERYLGYMFDVIWYPEMQLFSNSPSLIRANL